VRKKQEDDTVAQSDRVHQSVRTSYRPGKLPIALRVSVALGVAVLACSCSSGARGVAHGTALGHVYGSMLGRGEPMPRGSEIAELLLTIHNVSSQPVTIVRVELPGKGVGSVVGVEKIQMSPVLDGIHALPGGGYLTDPPVWQAPDGRCHSALLRPVAGFVLAPGAEARVFVVLRATGLGSFEIPSHHIYYSQAGTTYEQALPVGYKGIVAVGAPPWHPDRVEARCLGETTSLVASSTH
jgi:hypothetical protein